MARQVFEGCGIPDRSRSGGCRIHGGDLRNVLGFVGQFSIGSPDPRANHTHHAERELEGRLASLDSPLLSDSTSVSTTSGGICGNQGAETTSSNSYGKAKTSLRRQLIEQRELRMAFTRLRGDEYITLEYKPRKSGVFEFELDADRPVQTYIVGPRALERFEEGSKTFKYWGGFPEPRKHQKQKVWIPFSGPVYLIISNPDPHQTAEVEYEIYY